MIRAENAVGFADITLDAVVPEGTIALHVDVTAAPAVLPVVGQNGTVVNVPFGTVGVYRLDGRFKQVNSGGAGTKTVKAYLGNVDHLGS